MGGRRPSRQQQRTAAVVLLVLRLFDVMGPEAPVAFAHDLTRLDAARRQEGRAPPRRSVAGAFNGAAREADGDEAEAREEGHQRDSAHVLQRGGEVQPCGREQLRRHQRLLVQGAPHLRMLAAPLPLRQRPYVLHLALIGAAGQPRRPGRCLCLCRGMVSGGARLCKSRLRRRRCGHRCRRWHAARSRRCRGRAVRRRQTAACRRSWRHRRRRSARRLRAAN
mmetsp:Transcript_110757/g.307951  ORF Transcript_110757/g.307951 Transcript_110757/m.307951 type:complete len:222 (-) Transcript_110757:337-1002(-)